MGYLRIASQRSTHLKISCPSKEYYTVCLFKNSLIIFGKGLTIRYQNQITCIFVYIHFVIISKL